jgi:HlyD family secretion protein
MFNVQSVQTGLVDNREGGSIVLAARPARPRFRPAKQRNVLRLVVVVAFALIASVSALIHLKPKAVTSTAVVRGTAIDAVYATATVEALDRVTVKARVSGSILELKAREGDTVKRGDLLAVIDSPSLRFQLQRGKADQWAASQQASATSPQLAMIESQAKMTEASLKNAREDRDRLDRLVASGSVAEAERDRAKNNVTMLEAQLASQKAQTDALRIELTAKSSGSNAAVSELAARLADAEVRAPIDGVVLVRLVDPGELVPQSASLFKIGDVHKLVLECSVDEADIGRLVVGKKAAVSLYAFPKQVFHGDVFEILPDADRSKKSFLVKVRLEDAPPSLRIGMSAEVNIIVDERANALLAPAEAIDSSNSVWLLAGDRVEKRTVVTGIRDMLRVEILSGLSDGDHVILSGTEALAPGVTVKATFQAPDMSAVPAKASAGAGGSP